MPINGSTAVVTGASSGIGAATAQALARAGAQVALLARTEAALHAVAARIRATGGTAHVCAVDLTDADAVARATAAITLAHGPPDILVNSAGAGRWLFIEETSPDEAVAMMASPYFATFFITRAFVPDMLQRGSGQIVVINSPAALLPWPGSIAYAAARGALRAFTDGLRADLRGSGVSVTSVIAGKVTSNYWQHNPGAEERSPWVARVIPSLTPEQVATATLEAVAQRHAEIIIPRTLRAFALAHRIAPGLVRWIVTATGARRPD